MIKKSNFLNGEKRSATLDIAKGIGISLVVFGHSELVQNDKGELFRVIFSFHMPLFFFLSGILMRESDSIKNIATSRLHSLLKPYFLTFAILGTARLVMKQPVSLSLQLQVLEYIKGTLYATGRTIEWIPLWFLPHLFIVSIAAWSVAKIVRSDKNRILFAAASLIGGVQILSAQDLPWSIDLLPISLSFFMCGYLSRNLIQNIAFNLFHFIPVAIFFISLHYFFDETIDLNLRKYGNILTSTSQAYAGIYLTISIAAYLSQHVKITKTLSYIGAGSLFILILHNLFQWKLYVALHGRNAPLMITHLLAWLAGIILPLCIWEITKISRVLSLLFLSKK